MLYPIITKKKLTELYLDQNMSMMQISKHLNCSHHKVAYWMSKYGISRRHRSQASYLIHNPNGDPFKITQPKIPEEYILFGLGIGLYWGEGNKAHKNAIRIGNSDPKMLKCYIEFLDKLCGVSKELLKFNLQVFSDIDVNEALRYWYRELGVNNSQFFRPTITISGSLGTYKKKCEYGVVTIYFGNTKLRDIIVGQIANVAQRYGSDSKELSRRSLVVKRRHGKAKSTSSILVVGSKN